MSDILQQIQELQEDFINLFEVEGLGDPSNEVPPSTNKLSRRAKTKNGRVELVSVEDELFPYEGNKKEQFQQKVLDVINGMIQGTSTLEDLLQVVRNKKAPLKEAMELMEDIYDAIDKKYGRNKEGKREGRALELVGKVGDNMGREFLSAATRNAVKRFEDGELDKEEDSWDDAYDEEIDKIIKKRGMTKNYNGEQKTYKRQFKGDKEVTKDRWGEFPDDLAPTAQDWKRRREAALKSLKESMEILEGVLKTRNIDEIPDNEPVATAWKNDDGTYKVITFANKKSTINDKGTNKQLDGKTFKSSKAADNYAAKKGYHVHSYNEAFEGAIGILEELINEVSGDETPESLNPKAKKIYKKISNLHRGLNKKDIKGGYEQKNLFNQEELVDIANNSAEAQRKHSQRMQDALNGIKDSSSPENGNKENPQQLKLNFEPKKEEDEPLKEALEILEGLFIKDGRGDFLDDLSAMFTGKTLKQHFTNASKKAIEAGVNAATNVMKNAYSKIKARKDANDNTDVLEPPKKVTESLSPLQKQEVIKAIKFLKQTNKWKGNKDNLVDFLRDDAKNTVDYGYKHRHDDNVDLTKRKPAHFNVHENFEDTLIIVESIINEVSKEFLKDKRERANTKVNKAIIRHGRTMTPENPDGDSDLMKIRQAAIDRLKKYDKRCKEYLEKKENKSVK